MNKIITIGRECGSGGHSIATKVAETLGIPCYDKDIITMVSKKIDVDKEYIEKNGEQISGGILSHCLGFQDKLFPYAYPTIEDQINQAQVEVIESLAAKGPCVIVGRGADYILRKNPNTINVFIKASMEHKINISKIKHNLNEKEAKAILQKRDKERSKHYYFYTGLTWGDAKNYDMVLDSGKLGDELCAKIIVDAAKN